MMHTGDDFSRLQDLGGNQSENDDNEYSRRVEARNDGFYNASDDNDPFELGPED